MALPSSSSYWLLGYVTSLASTLSFSSFTSIVNGEEVAVCEPTVTEAVNSVRGIGLEVVTTIFPLVSILIPVTRGIKETESMMHALSTESLMEPVSI